MASKSLILSVFRFHAELSGHPVAFSRANPAEFFTAVHIFDLSTSFVIQVQPGW